MQTKRILSVFAKPGMIVAKDIYTLDNTLLMKKGSILDERRIKHLEINSILNIYINSECSSNPEKDNNKATLTYSEQIKNSKEYKQFHKDYDSCILEFRNEMNSLISNNDTIDSDRLLSETAKLVKSSRNSIHLFDMIHNIRDYDDLTFAHSINVSLICNIIGHWINYSNEEIDILTLAGLLHDVGKLKMPHSLITKPGRLTQKEYNLIKTHPLQGYSIVRDKKLDPRIKRAVLEHHERCDGSGYPLGRKSDEIHDFSKIVSIADVYDAMTSTRVYRKGICPFDVIELFEQDGMSKYDVRFLNPFLNNVVQTYMNNNVLLNDGTIGKVIMVNNNTRSKPVIQVDNSFIDTSKDNNVHIESII